MAQVVGRQASTTSLSKYARVNSPNLSNPSLDFCNAFWGAGDAGVDVLFARMRGAARSVEEVRVFWKERAAIEEEYAKRLSKLAKTALGRDEIGELKNSLDTLRLETDKQAGSHLNLANQVRTELETPASAFSARQQQFKRNAQAVIEKAFKNKQQQEAYVTKAREKYEADCMRINSYTAQSTLVQGKDLDKIQGKLDRAKQTVTANERDFANFAKALQGTVEKWEKDWKAFSDACQDMEEERIEFMKDNVWAYANAVSTVCVSDDESCEKIRISLEQLEPERDMENFVRDYGTGNIIPDPPKFISYTNPETATSQQAMSRYAHFPRSSSRQLSMDQAMRAPPLEEEPDGPGVAGYGAVGGGNVSRSNTLGSRPISSSAPANGMSPTRSSTVQSASTVPTASTPATSVPNSAHGPGERTMLAIGGGVYEVDPQRDPQSAPNSAGPVGPGATESRVGAGDDPLAKQMEQLRMGAAQSGQVRRNSVNASRPGTGTGYHSTSPVPSAGPGPTSVNGAPGPALAAPLMSKSPKDYRNSAELVVGGPPPSRPTSPGGPPVAAHMLPPEQKPSSPLPVESILSTYQQSLPGERRASVSRSTSPNMAASHTHSQSLGQNISRGNSIDRPLSREGFAGIGANGRSPSPGPGPGPGPSASVPNASQNAYRIPSPSTAGNLGISLDESGRVTHDDMAEQYRYRQPTASQPLPPQNQFGMPPNRSGSVQMTSPVGPPPSQPQYGAPAPAPYSQPPFGVPPPPSNGANVQRTPSVWYGSQGQQPPYGAPQPQQPPPVNQYGQQANGRQSSLGYPNPNGAGYHNTGYQDPGQVRRSPSPAVGNAPTGQWIDGKPVLFYVKSLYDYQASIEEEFDFQAGDVIAVTSTPEDGWWTGVLLDDSRRIPGRTVFPSNFVCLF